MLCSLFLSILKHKKPCLEQRPKYLYSSQQLIRDVPVSHEILVMAAHFHAFKWFIGGMHVHYIWLYDVLSFGMFKQTVDYIRNTCKHFRRKIN